MAQRRAYHASSDPRFQNLGRYLAAVASIEVAVKNDRTLSPATLIVALYIIGLWRGAESLQLRYCHPPGEKIAADLDLGERTVDYAIAALKRAGYFRVHPGSKRRQQANRYFPIAQKAPAVAIKTTPAVAKVAAVAVAELSEEEQEAADNAAWAEQVKELGRACAAAGMPCEKIPGWDAFRRVRGNFLMNVAGLPKPITRAGILETWRWNIERVAKQESQGNVWNSLEVRDQALAVLDEIDLAGFNT